MLLVKTVLSQSRIPNAGIGLFADQDIPKGTKIWTRKSPFVITLTKKYGKKGATNLNSVAIKQLKKYSYSFGDYYFYCCDNARFINHSSKPNLKDICIKNKEFKNHPLATLLHEQYTIAKRDIKRGEELTCNYAKMGLTKADKKFNIKGLK